MPRRSILSAAERDNLLALPSDKEELIRHYTLAESDLSIIARHRGAANRVCDIEVRVRRRGALPNSLQSGR